MINFLIFLLLLYLLLVIWMNLRHPVVKWKEHKINIAEYRFPKSFFWGAATSAYQVEGGSYNADWAEWEKSYDSCGNPHIKNGDRCGNAADHWHRYREDLRLLKDLGCNSYRFSVEWSRLVPQPGKWDPAAADHYVEMCRWMRDLEIEPNLTLHHFTLPRWLAEKGGFEHPDSISYFADFTQKTAETLGPFVDYWATFNEPVALALMGWIRGVWPPGKQDICLAARVLGNILEAHQQAYRILHATVWQDSDGDGVPCQVGIVKNLTIFDPARKWHLLDWLCARQVNKLYNDAVLDAFQGDRFRFNLLNRVRYEKELPGLSDMLDWIGINYYTQFLTKFDPASDQKIAVFPTRRLPKTDMGWAVYPAGLYRALQRVNGFGIPVFVTENGIATEDDQLREDFILKHVDAMHEAILDKVDVRGYYYWSLMDNFEWAEGFDKRFGLYYVDYQTQERTLKNGADIIHEIIDRNRSEG